MNTEAVQEVLSDFFRAGGIDLEGAEIVMGNDNELFVNLSLGDDTVRFIGRRGEVLHSLQHLIKNIFRSGDILPDGAHIKVDVDSYRKKQEENVLEMAKKRAESVLESGRPTTLPPMSGFFRRLVHLYIKENFPALETSSRGMGNGRAVGIRLADDESSSSEEPMTDLYSELDL